MITILNTNKERLVAHIAKCHGAVYLHLADGTFCDIKNDTLAANMFRLMELPKGGIQLSLSDSNDFPGFVRYMMEVGAKDKEK